MKSARARLPPTLWWRSARRGRRCVGAEEAATLGTCATMVAALQRPSSTRRSRQARRGRRAPGADDIAVGAEFSAGTASTTMLW